MADKEIIFDPVDHSYTDAYGQVYVPVTTLCKMTPRAVDFTKLPNRKAVEQARLRGTMVHEEIEAFVKRGEEGISLTFQWFKRVLYPLFTNWESEVIIHSESGATKYAGTIDLIAYDPKSERWVIIDLKTGGHETVDYQESFYKRAFCEIRGIDPQRVDLACIDARDESEISLFSVRTISDAWLDELLQCFADDLPYIEPLPTLNGFSETQIAQMESIEAYINTIETDLKSLKAKQEEYKAQLLEAMENALVDTFTIGSLMVTRVKETISKTFDSKRFKEDHKDLYEQYQTETRKKSYLKITVRDITKKEQ